MFVLTLTDDKLLKFVLIWGKSCVVFVWGEKLGWPRTPFIILLRSCKCTVSSDLQNRFLVLQFEQHVNNIKIVLVRFTVFIL